MTTKIFGTHSGNFHTDDVYAIAALSLLYREYEIRRSRDPAVWSTCDFLVDVGGVYDHQACIYDHHFKGGPVYDDGLPLSSIGLVWRHYGEQICGSEFIAKRICKSLIRNLDAHDNGINIWARRKGSLQVRDVSISDIVSSMNPPGLEGVDEVFGQEVVRARAVIKAQIENQKHWLKCKTVVDTACEYALKNNLQYMEVAENINWMEHLFNQKGAKSILYVFYPSGGNWYSRTVPAKPGEFANKKSFPEAWAGKREDELSEIIGISDAVFCHHAAFICGAKSRQSIITMVKKAIEA